MCQHELTETSSHFEWILVGRNIQSTSKACLKTQSKDTRAKNHLEDLRQVSLKSEARHDICHMHHMQRMCKIISPRIRFYILMVPFEQFM